MEHKMQSTGVSVSPLKHIVPFFTKTFQRVLLNGQSSSWQQDRQNVLDEIFINELTKNLSPTAKLLADNAYESVILITVKSMA